MKLSSFMLPAAAGLVTAAYNDAEFYLLRQGYSHDAPQLTGWSSLSGNVAQAILQQRLSLDLRLPESEDEMSSVVSDISRFGKPTLPLFSDDVQEPHQLVVVLKGLDDKHFESSWHTIHLERAFTVNDGMADAQLPPLYNTPACSFAGMIDPEQRKCWKNTNQYLEYDVTKNPESLKDLAKNFEKLEKLAAESKMETMVVLLPATTPSKSAEDELRRREFTNFKSEQVMTDRPSVSESQTSDVDDKKPKKLKAKPIPQCFSSEEKCMNETSSCNAHGQCTNKFGKEAKTQCWSCRCMSTKETDQRNNAEVLYHWGGNMCQKIDISTPFWLFVSFSIVMVGLVAGSIGLLFSVGEEKLPGVIGAGVSRSK